MSSPLKPAATSYHSRPGSSSSDSLDNARFTPGTMLAGRYRVVGLLGKGGMGEVYRADDLKLRQPVALKFLPATIDKDDRKLERFLHEVRVARQVSHPNVCRVYDIAEVGGQHFISMEYVDGEDLAAVLRRMGRPSKEKSLQIARQLCAGLAAAHDKGVLHRDLKPHNIMIDGEGRVRITDFGLAGFVEEFAGKEVHAGTPAYMAPEQLAGRSVSTKSDIYSLGLVLGELFTGKRIFEGADRDRALRSRTSSPTSLSSLADDVDPAVERVILRCLEPDPASRPSSALAVAAALPGADPLAAALAAGETPSPEMVANAGEVGGMRPAIAIACLVVILGGMFAIVPFFRSASVARLIPLPKPPAALADRAGEILKKLGHTDPVVDTAHGFYTQREFFRHVEETDKSVARWDRLASTRPSPVGFWYRTSPRPLVPAKSSDRISPNDPPLQVSQMATVTLDPLGRLVGLAVEPPQHESETTDIAPRKPTDWSVMFSEAQIDLNLFSPTEPRWSPGNYCDERAAWEGRFPDQPDVPIRIEAGAYRGTPTYFQIVAPWTKPWRMEEWPTSLGQKAADVTVLSILVILVFAGVLVARHNLKLRRSDRAGANRLAMVCLLLLIASWILVINYVADIWEEFNRLRILIGQALVAVAVMWLWYIALEPYVRRRWPHALISWSRLLAGRIRDPLVGRDILVGGVGALGQLANEGVAIWMNSLLGLPPFTPDQRNWEFLLGLRFQIGAFFDPVFVFFPLAILFLLLRLRLLLRREWLTIAVVLALEAGLTVASAPGDQPLASTIIWAVMRMMVVAIGLLVILRFGLLAFAFLFFFGNLIEAPAFWGLTGWQSGPSWTAILIVTAITVYGFHTALAGRSLFRDELMEA
ncbi:MAG: serine/threonine protein kinase [Planctomycetes bacterium]|nr:serine/threonine protein kinase [Planctomycetota bacterium]MBI3834322.1 serine/threonine protein kinase [Planctomycetota bacterium]